MAKTTAERQREHRLRQARKLIETAEAAEAADRMKAALFDILEMLKDNQKEMAVKVRQRAEEGLKA